MGKNRFWSLALGSIFLWPALTSAQVGEKYNLEIEGRYWRPTLDTTLRVVDKGIGTDVKAVDDLGMEKHKDFGEGRLQIKFFSKHKFNLSYLPLKWDGDQIISRTIEFSGKTYTAGTRVQSKLDLDLFKGGYEYDFLAGSYGFLGGSFDVVVAHFDAELQAPNLAIDQKESRTVPLPMVGLVGRIYPVKWVNLTGKVSGLPLGGYGHVFDAEGSLNINPVTYVGISAGYRYFETRAKYTDNLLNFSLAGPFVALDIRF